jgi:hypothetical protein
MGMKESVRLVKPSPCLVPRYIDTPHLIRVGPVTKGVSLEVTLLSKLGCGCGCGWEGGPCGQIYKHTRVPCFLIGSAVILPLCLGAKLSRPPISVQSVGSVL